MDIHDALDEALNVLEAGKARAFGGGAVVDRDRLVDLIGKIRSSLPEEIVEAKALLAQRESILGAANEAAEQHLAQAQQQAADIVAQARVTQDQLVAEHEVLSRATAQADTILHETQERGARMQAEVDDYVAAKLDALAGTLHKTLATVQAGRDRIGGTARP